MTDRTTSARGDPPVAILTGLSHPVGAAIARRFARAGNRLLLADGPPGLRTEIETAARAMGGEAAAPDRTGDEGDADTIVGAALSRFGRLDMLIRGPERGGDEAWLAAGASTDGPGRQLESFLRLTRAAIRPMIDGDGGRIVHVVSAAGRYRSAYMQAEGMPASFALGASRDGAILAATRQLAFELAPRKIRLNAVAMGLIRTPETEAVWRGLSERDRQFLSEEISLQRLGEPEEVAAVVEFLASPASSYVTGTAIDVNGGWWMS
ncbi:MAG: SDR family NAD(P)-dependent oxidoreductase [Dongiaceae bacterium]